ncbi:MAG: CoA-binding protein [bacterium]|nr:CoA-binding protein [bacterium]
MINLNPKSIALIGANNKPGSVGLGLARNLLEGKNKRKIYFINPFQKKILELKTFNKVSEVKNKIDLAIIAINAKIVPEVLNDCVQKGVKEVIIISSGFGETGKPGEILEQKIQEILKNKKIRVIGPNCLGIIRPSLKLNATFAPITPREGNIAFLSQSGALIDAIIDKSNSENLGFSTIVSYGNEMDVNLNEFLEFLEKDKETKTIIIYLEGIKKAREFFKIAKRISAKKPIIILKGGRTQKGKTAAKSHTASLAGSYEIFSGACSQFGLLQADTLEEVFDFAKILSWQPRIKNKISIITNAGGAGVLATDYAQNFGVETGNLIDLIGDASSEKYKEAILSELKKEEIGGIIVIQTVQFTTNPIENAKMVINAKKLFPKKAIVACFLGGNLSKKAVELLEKNKIPNYSDLKRSMAALNIIINKNSPS